MKINELIEATASIELKSLGVHIGERRDEVDTTCVYEDQTTHEYVLRQIDDCQNVWEQRGTEEDICRKAWALIRLMA